MINSQNQHWNPRIRIHPIKYNYGKKIKCSRKREKTLVLLLTMIKITRLYSSAFDWYYCVADHHRDKRKPQTRDARGFCERPLGILLGYSCNCKKAVNECTWKLIFYFFPTTVIILDVLYTLHYKHVQVQTYFSCFKFSY